MRGNILLDPRVDDQAVQNARRDHGTPTVQLAYPRKGIWSGQNQLGVELPFELDASRMQTIFKMDEWGFPEIWTLALSVTLPKDLVQNQIFDIVGEVSFGSGGIVQTFEVDWVVGTVFSLPMNAVNVRARWSDLATFKGVLPPEGIRVSVIISRGGIRHARATKTSSFLPLGAGGSAVNPFTVPVTFVPIPPFAKSVVVQPRTLAAAAGLYAADASLQLLESNFTAIPSPVSVVPGNLLGPTTSFKVPIPANARYWTITAGAAPIPDGGSLLWNLFDE
jgi:hypothetical protein